MKTYSIISAKPNTPTQTAQSTRWVGYFAKAAQALGTTGNFTVIDESTGQLHTLEIFLKK